MTRATDKARGLTPGVDSQPTVQDVYIHGAWRTVLVGSLRLGGRGVYALDITYPASVSEAAASSTVMWEFNNLSTGGADLGYTFGRPNIARLNNGKWVALVSSGYFPKGPVTDTYDDPASVDPAAAKTSLFVLDLEDGHVIRELKTSSATNAAGVTTFGLSQPGLYDVGGDQVDDIAVAGDLAGNLWRFDLTSSDPASWTVDLMFKSYPSASNNGNGAGTCDAFGKCPITVMPIGMRNPDTRGIVWIFGTGKYLGKDDRSNNIPAQSFYGIYDFGAASTNYPIVPSKLNVQEMTESTISGVLYRFVSTTPITTVANARGWTLPLNIAAESGERNVVTAFPLDTSNRVILATLIPTTSDPCTPGRKGAVIVLDAASGIGVPVGTETDGSGRARSGVVDTSGAIPSSGDSLPVTSAVGGGVLGLLGLDHLSIPDNYWYRTAWRRLLDSL
jgi:type IV pilus assembly protein PilY1